MIGDKVIAGAFGAPQKVEKLSEDEKSKILKEWQDYDLKYQKYLQEELYKTERLKEYPSVGDQLDMLWHSMDSGEIPKSTAFFMALKAVKDKYPKPLTQGV